MRTNEPFPTQADYVIIGGGISGVSIAWHLARKGAKNIVLLEKHHLSWGATGRCGAGIRQQWSTEANCLLAKRSVEFFERANRVLDYDDDIEFKQEGYLIVASTKEEDAESERNVALQNSLGIRSVKLTREEAKAHVPHLETSDVLSATFCATDGHLNPFKTTDAFYKAATKLGVKVFTNTEVLSISKEDRRITGVATQRGKISTPVVINAAGGHAQLIGAMAGVDIPVYSQNREILVTEPIERMQGPMVISFSKNIYCQQTPHGAFIMGRGDERPPGYTTESTHGFLDEMARTVSTLLPPVGELRVIRQWGGLYNMSPDHQPILSRSEDAEGFYMACGFSGHGFMLAPMTGLLLSELILGEPPSLDMGMFSLERFKDRDPDTFEKSVV